MARFFKKVGELFTVPPEDYAIDVPPGGEGLGFLKDTDDRYQADWTDLHYAKLLSHMCIFAQFVDKKASILVNLGSPVVPFLELFDAMMDAREEYQHGTAEVHKRPQFYAPSTAKGIMVLSVMQRRQIEAVSASWEYDRNFEGAEGEFLDLATEYVTELEHEEMEEARRAGHKKNDDVFTGDADLEAGPVEPIATNTGDMASRTDLDVEGGIDIAPEVVEQSEYRAPDTIPDPHSRGSFASTSIRDESGSSEDIVLKSYIFATVSEYDIFCIFTSMELSDALFMTCLDNFLRDVSGRAVGNAMDEFREYLIEMYPVMSRPISTRREGYAEYGEEDDEEEEILPADAILSPDRVPPRGTRSAMFASRGNGLLSSTTSMGLDSEGPSSDVVDGLRSFLGFDPSIYYMTQLSDEYKKRGRPLVQIINLMDSVCNGVSNIIDEAYATHSTPHAHINPPQTVYTTNKEGEMTTTDGVIMPDTIEVKWEQLQLLDSMINELRRWTKQTVKIATAIDK